MQHEHERKFLLPTYIRQQWDNGVAVSVDGYTPGPGRARPRVDTELFLDQSAEPLDGEPPLRLRGIVPLFTAGDMAFGASAVGADHERDFLIGLVQQASRRPLRVLLTNKSSGGGISRQERQWVADGITLTPESAKIRAYVPYPRVGQDWASVGIKEVVIDHYIYPEIPYDILEIEGAENAVKAIDASDWRAFGFGFVKVTEVTGSKEWSNATLSELARRQRQSQ